MAALLLCVFEMISQPPQNHYYSLGYVREGKSSSLFTAHSVHHTNNNTIAQNSVCEHLKRNSKYSIFTSTQETPGLFAL